MRHKKYFLFIIGLFSALSNFAQAPTNAPTTKGNKGRFYFFWGYNRGYFTRSDLHLNGNNYDFTLHNIVATDRHRFLSKSISTLPNSLFLSVIMGLGFTSISITVFR